MARFPGRGAVVTVLNTLLAVPSVVVGLVVYLLLSRSGPLGSLGWLFTFKAMVHRAVLLVVPVCRRSRARWSRMPERARRTAAVAGARRPARPAARLRRALCAVTVLLACFGRAVSEVGAVMIVGGNIDGFTRVMTTAIALETSKGDLPLALGSASCCSAWCSRSTRVIALVARWRGAHAEGMVLAGAAA